MSAFLRIVGQDNSMKKILFLISIIVLSLATTSAAELFFVQTKDIRSGELVFDVMLDPEEEQVNAFSGTIIIPDNLVFAESVDTKDSIAPIWMKSPQSSLQENIKKKEFGKISFEGVIPGGFDGIRSPYYEGRRAGKIFTLTLRPKSKGEGYLSLDNVSVLKNDGKATPAYVITRSATIVIPDLKTIPIKPKGAISQQASYRDAIEKTLDAYVIRNEDIAGGKWAVVIEDDNSRHTILGYRVAESASAITDDVPFFEWKEATSPFILSYQNRNRFIHVEALYADGTRNIKIISPVENASDELTLWRILIGIAIGIIVVYVLQKRHVIQSFLIFPKNAP